jgi:prophage regulatory protein
MRKTCSPETPRVRKHVMPKELPSQQSFELFRDTPDTIAVSTSEQDLRLSQPAGNRFGEIRSKRIIGQHLSPDFEPSVCLQKEASCGHHTPPITEQPAGRPTTPKGDAASSTKTPNIIANEGSKASIPVSMIVPASVKSVSLKPPFDPAVFGGKRKRGRPAKSSIGNKLKGDRGVPPGWTAAVQYLTVGDVAALLRVSKATIWRWVKTNPDFPKPRKLSNGATRWSFAEIVAFSNGEQVEK